MKKVHIALLVLIAGAIAVLLTFLKGASTYDSIETAIAKPGKFVHLMAKLDKSQPVEYDARKDANFLSFTAVDSTGASIKVVYHNTKPDNFEMSEKLVLKGKYNNGIFDCKEIQTKCPSKYKDDLKANTKSMQEASLANQPEQQTLPASSNSKEKKY
jgi:cytochrome c-type biogenesis protein CcmE